MIAEQVQGRSQRGDRRNDDELMEKYFAGEEISTEESTLALHEGIISGDIVPVYCGSAAKLWGIRALLDAIEGSFPRHTAKEKRNRDRERRRKAVSDRSRRRMLRIRVQNGIGSVRKADVLQGNVGHAPPRHDA